MTINSEIKTVAITKTNGVGTLTRGDQDRWDIRLNGKAVGAATYYTTEQVQRIVERAISEGHKVETA